MPRETSAQRPRSFGRGWPGALAPRDRTDADARRGAEGAARAGLRPARRRSRQRGHPPREQPLRHRPPRARRATAHRDVASPTGRERGSRGRLTPRASSARERATRTHHPPTLRPASTHGHRRPLTRPSSPETPPTSEEDRGRRGRPGECRSARRAREQRADRWVRRGRPRPSVRAGRSPPVRHRARLADGPLSPRRRDRSVRSRRGTPLRGT